MLHLHYHRVRPPQNEQGVRLSRTLEQFPGCRPQFFASKYQLRSRSQRRVRFQPSSAAPQNYRQSRLWLAKVKMETAQGVQWLRVRHNLLSCSGWRSLWRLILRIRHLLDKIDSLTPAASLIKDVDRRQGRSGLRDSPLWIQASRAVAAMLAPMPDTASNNETANTVVCVLAIGTSVLLLRPNRTKYSNRERTATPKAPRPTFAQGVAPCSANPVSLNPQNG